MRNEGRSSLPKAVGNRAPEKRWLLRLEECQRRNVAEFSDAPFYDSISIIRRSVCSRRIPLLQSAGLCLSGVVRMTMPLSSRARELTKTDGMFAGRPRAKMLIQHLPLLAKKYIVLASASPRRAELLQGLGLKPAIIPSTFAENLDSSSFSGPGEYALETAREKAKEVSSRVENGRLADLVIGADTVVELDGQILEKPRDQKDAFRMLSSLSGRQHKVYTGVSIVLPNFRDPKSGRLQPLVQGFWAETKVEFAQMEKEAIDAYIASGEPMDKAGAYGIQGIGGAFVKGIEGCYYNVMGFPVHRFAEQLDILINAGCFECESLASEFTPPKIAQKQL